MCRVENLKHFCQNARLLVPADLKDNVKKRFYAAIKSIGVIEIFLVGNCLYTLYEIKILLAYCQTLSRGT